jgi:hypothetical protein
MSRPTVEERFWAKVDKSGDCWMWTASKVKDGYGGFKIGGKFKSAHRVAYELMIGPIPEGYQVDHRCHQPACVRPEHLRAVTPKQNCENTKGSYRNNRTGALGVSRNSRGKYVVRVSHNGKYNYGGSFADFDQAAEVARQLRSSLFTHNDADRKAA